MALNPLYLTCPYMDAKCVRSPDPQVVYRHHPLEVSRPAPGRSGGAECPGGRSAGPCHGAACVGSCRARKLALELTEIVDTWVSDPRRGRRGRSLPVPGGRRRLGHRDPSRSPRCAAPRGSLPTRRGTRQLFDASTHTSPPSDHRQRRPRSRGRWRGARTDCPLRAAAACPIPIQNAGARDRQFGARWSDPDRHIGNMPPADIGARSVTPGRR